MKCSVYHVDLYNTLFNYRDLIGYLRSRDMKLKFHFHDRAMEPTKTFFHCTVDFIT